MTASSYVVHLCTLVLLASSTSANARGQSPASRDSLPSDYPGLSVLVNDHPAPGLLFFNPIALGPPTYSYTSLLGSDLQPVFSRRHSGSISDFTLQPNGSLTVFDNAASCFYVLDMTFAVVDSFRCAHGYTTDGHDIQLTSEGHALLLGRDPRVMDMSRLVANGKTSATILGAVIQELDAHKNVLFEWKSLDHIPVTDATHEDLTANVIDYIHVNSLAIDLDGNLLLSSRHLDEVTKIHRSTGDIIWRLGGKYNQFTFLNDTVGFSHQHDARRLPNGHLTLFDNGNFHTPQFSRAVEYALDEEKRTVTLVWEYRHSPQNFARATGNVQRLPNGNTLISWGTENTITEVRPDGTTALEVVVSPGFGLYRTFKFPWPVSTLAGALPLPESPVLLPAYPNPFNAGTMITVRFARGGLVRLAVYGMLGQEVATLKEGWQPAGLATFSFVPAGLASGVYIVRLQAEGRSQSMRIDYIR